MTAPAPYKTTPIWDEVSLPAAIRTTHRTKEGVWGLLVVLEGQVRLVFEDGQPEQLAAPATPA